MPQLTVLIPCKNEESHIAECVASARLVADEVLVADSGSSDATLEIIRELGGCRVIEREFVNYADFKNWAIPQARHRWVLLLDADERVTPELAAEIKALLASEPSDDAFWIGRDNYFLGHRIRYSGWGNSRVVRLIRRDACRYLPGLVHETMQVAAGKTGDLQARLLHYTAENIEEFVAKQNNYSTLAARQAKAAGKRCGFLFTLLHAPLRFLQLYLLRGGFRDGYPGLMVCGIMAYYTFLKDINLWSFNQASNRLKCEPKPQTRRAA